MSWNYRVIRHKDKEWAVLTIHEVYYDADGNPNGVTESAIAAYGDTMLELRDNHAIQARAFDLPILDYSMFIVEEDND